MSKYGFMHTHIYTCVFYLLENYNNIIRENFIWPYDMYKMFEHFKYRRAYWTVRN